MSERDARDHSHNAIGCAAELAASLRLDAGRVSRHGAKIAVSARLPDLTIASALDVEVGEHHPFDDAPAAVGSSRHDQPFATGISLSAPYAPAVPTSATVAASRHLDGRTARRRNEDPAEAYAVACPGPRPSTPSRCIVPPCAVASTCTSAQEGTDVADPIPDRRIRYERYMCSDAWRDSPARIEEIALAGGRCRLCARGAPTVRIEVHHRDYARLGAEHVSDLTTLCGDCHTMVTTELRRRRYASLVLPELRDTPRVLADRALVDRSASS